MITTGSVGFDSCVPYGARRNDGAFEPPPPLHVHSRFRLALENTMELCDNSAPRAPGGACRIEADEGRELCG